ncbi:MAG: hypothetical protein RL557_1056, partial [archaeon]
DNKVYPGANEICDGKDNDCDGQVDENNGMCESGKICTSGQCVPAICYEDEDCGEDDFINTPFCDIGSGDIYQEYRLHECKNPGGASSSCSSQIDEKLVVDCSYGCNPSTNTCITEICTDGKDNDGDGLIDGLTELNPNNGLTYVYPTNNPLWGYAYNPFELEYQVANISQTYGMGYNIYYTNNVAAIARSYNAWYAPPYGSGDYYSGTLTKVCNVLGYSTVTWHECDSAFGDGCNYDSPGDNYLWQFNGTDFVGISAEPKYAKSWVSRIWCKDKLPACSDGRDNDHDGKIDSNDDGCASANDDSEIAHDPECEI